MIAPWRWTVRPKGRETEREVARWGMTEGVGYEQKGRRKEKQGKHSDRGGEAEMEEVMEQ